MKKGKPDLRIAFRFSAFAVNGTRCPIWGRKRIKFCVLPVDGSKSKRPQRNSDRVADSVRLPGLASDKNLAGVHDTAGQARGVDGAQRRAELDDVGPDQGLGEQAGVLPRWGGFVLPCTERRDQNLTQRPTAHADYGLSSICSFT